MKYKFEISDRVTSPTQLQALTPASFSYGREGEHLFLFIEVPDNFTLDQVWSLVDREADRLYFLTGVQLAPEIRNCEASDGRISEFLTFSINLVTKKPLPQNITQQVWIDSLPLQLRLWQLAHIENMPINTRIVLLFQIIEAEYPDTNDPIQYPQYKGGITIDSVTEAKLIRDWVGHQKGTHPIFRSQLDHYRRHLGVTAFYNPTNPTHAQLITSLLAKVTEEARKVITAKITTS